jgi:fatty acid desaturase
MFRHREDRLPVLLMFCLFCIDVSVYLTVDNVVALLAYAFISMLPKAGVCAFNHHHQHVSTFHVAWANRLIELMYVLQTGVSSQAWVLHHSLGHHLNYLDQTKDESRWARDDGTVMGPWEYAVVTTATAYPRAFKVSERHPRQRRIFLMMGLASLALMAALVAFRPVPGLLIFVMVPLAMFFGTAAATYEHHSNRATDNDFVACNNIIQPFYNLLTGNLGYHTAHHHRPGMHWSKLPQLHEEIRSKIPREAYTQPGYPWRLFGESRGAEHYAGIQSSPGTVIERINVEQRKAS